MAKQQSYPYENNPFMIGIEGLKLIFGQAKSVGIYSIVLTATTFLLAVVAYLVMLIVNFGTGGTTVESSTVLTADEALRVLGIVILGCFVYLSLSLLVFGPLEYTAAKTAQGTSVTLGESFKAVLAVFPSYVWMYVIFSVKVLLWSLLLIVPGIIMFNRYILAGTVFFAEDKRGNAAIKRSAELTKGGWFTTYGGAWIWNIISQGVAALVFWPGSMAILYRQFVALEKTGEPKPPAHILSWLTLFVPIALTVLYMILMVLLFIIIAQMPTT